MSGEAWLLHLLAGLMRPRQRLSVSTWADAHRVLSAKSSAHPGPWRTARNPLLRAIMDSLSEDVAVPRVVIQKPSQFGGTEVATNWLGYIMGHIRTPKPTLIVLPTDRLLVKWVLQRLRPMVEEAECLRDILNVSKSRDGTNRLDIVDYPGGILFLSPSNSAAALKSDSIRFVVQDECDEYPWEVGGRGDPEGLIASRQAAFQRRKTLMLSTPSVDGASRIASAYEVSDQRQYWVCCPHCGERQVLEWEHLQWTHDLSKVWYACGASGCVIDEREKPGMFREATPDYPQGGRWIAKYPERSQDCHGYQWSALYCSIGLGYSWRDLAAQWLAAQGDDGKLQGFVNERLGRVWADRRTATRVEDLASRAEPYALRTIPPGVGLITAGVDTQDDRLAVQIVGWGAGGAWWVLDYVELPGQTADLYGKDGILAPVYAALTDLLSRPLATAAGVHGWIEAVAHDMGGHSTEAVKAFSRQTRLTRFMAVIGSRFRLNMLLGKPKRIDCTVMGRTLKHGAEFREVGTEAAKDILYGTVRDDADREPAARSAHISQDLAPPGPEEAPYIGGLLSEVWDAKKQRYVPRRGMTRRNEPLDTWVYARAAAEHPELRLSRMRPIDWEARARRLGFETRPGAEQPPAVSHETPAEGPGQGSVVETPARAVPAVKPPAPGPGPRRPPGRGGWVGRWK